MPSNHLDRHRGLVINRLARIIGQTERAICDCDLMTDLEAQKAYSALKQAQDKLQEARSWLTEKQ